MLAIVLVLGVLNLLFGTHLRQGAGLGSGMDGVTYARMVRDLPGMIARGELSTYYAQRVLSSATVRGTLPMMLPQCSSSSSSRACSC
jgi:hypothetical protein